MSGTGIDPQLREVTARLEARIEEIMDVIALRLREEVPELRASERPEMWTPWREGTRAMLATAFAALKRSRDLPRAAPPQAAESARLAARARIPLPVVLKTYRVGQAVAWEFWLEEVDRLPTAPVTRRSLLTVGSHYMFQYVDVLTNYTTEDYTEERDRVLRSREQERLGLVRDLLDGADLDLSSLEYGVEWQHVGVICWGNDPGRSITDLASLLDRRVLTVPAAPDTLWGWLGGRQPLGSKLGRLLTRYSPHEDTAMAVGHPAPGIDGFRRTHRDARLAHGIAAVRPRPLTLYDDVALESFALQDELLAQDFVTRELGPLGGSDQRAARLRDTLRCYFEASHNASAAASRLGVHERTVANRIRAIEDSLGRPVTARRAELETALRLHALFTA